MSSSYKQRDALATSAFDMQHNYVAQDATQPTSNNTPDITPYVGLRGKLSQVWINRWTVLLFLVLARTLIAIANLHDGVGDARKEALSACTGVESMGSALASMPHYLSQGTNELTASGVEKAINGLMSMLTLSVTGVEEIVVFVINLLTSTYVCLITFAVSGSLHAALQLIEDVSGFLNKTIGAIGTDIHKGINDFDADLNKVIGGLNDIGKAFGSANSIPTLNINGSLDQLDHLQLPAGLNADLQKLNNSIPTFAQVNNFTNNAIRFPFEEIKKLMNESRSNYTFDRSLFPVPSKDQLTFCSDNSGINDFFNELVKVEILAKKIGIAVLVILATLVCIPMTFREMQRWRTMQKRSQLISTRAHDPLDVVYIAARPYTSSAGMQVADRFTSSRRQTLARWTVAYATTPPALFVLSLGIAGLFSCLCQYIMLRAVEREVPALAHDVGVFAERVVSSLENASEHWANGTNTVILHMNNRINHDVFGWVNISTTALNNTLNTFSDEMTKALNATFGGTILYDPITEVFNCLIGLKIAGIEKGLTWISDHAHIDFPLLPNNTFSLGAAASITNDNSATTFLADPQQDATDQVTAAVNQLGDKLARGIRNEAIISSCVVLVWVIILMMGIARAAMLFYGDDKTWDSGSQKSPMIPLTAAKITDEKNIASQKPRGDRRSPEPSPPYQYTAPVTTGSGHSSDANQYKGASYTITPQPFPTFEAISAPGNAAPLKSAVRDFLAPPVDERVGYAGARAVDGAMQRPTHQRASSYADLGGTSPVESRNTSIPTTFDRLGH